MQIKLMIWKSNVGRNLNTLAWEVQKLYLGRKSFLHRKHDISADSFEKQTISFNAHARAAHIFGLLSYFIWI